MNRRGFFIFEPVIVGVFIGAILIAAFITLQATTDALSVPLGGHATTLVRTYAAAEHGIFLSRELNASYALQDAVYLLASGAGTKGAIGCVLPGATAPGLANPIATRSIPDTAALTETLLVIVEERLRAPVPYEFAVRSPLVVSGIPLKPESILIPLPATVIEARRRQLQGTLFTPGIGGQIPQENLEGSYNARLAFTLKYNYPFKETYDALRAGLAVFDAPSDPNNCRTYAGDAKTDCVKRKVAELNLQQTLLTWAMEPAGTDEYVLDITHNYALPLCTNKPVTRIRLALPTKQ